MEGVYSCNRQEASIETDIHAMHEIFNENKADAIILVDSENTFNTINRKILLLNIADLCPDLATFICIWSVIPPRLFIIGGKEMTSREEKTHSDPIAIVSYVIRLTPLLDNLQSIINGNKHVAFADELKDPRKFHQMILW